MIVKLNNKHVDTDKLTYEETKGFAIELDESIAQIKRQLLDASTNLRETGEYADPAWYRSATFALKALQRNRQDVQTVISIKRRKTRLLDSFFMEVAQEFLPEEDYLRLLTIAQQRKNDV